MVDPFDCKMYDKEFVRSKPKSSQVEENSHCEFCGKSFEKIELKKHDKCIHVVQTESFDFKMCETSFGNVQDGCGYSSQTVRVVTVSL